MCVVCAMCYVLIIGVGLCVLFRFTFTRVVLTAGQLNTKHDDSIWIWTSVDVYGRLHQAMRSSLVALSWKRVRVSSLDSTNSALMYDLLLLFLNGTVVY